MYGISISGSLYITGLTYDEARELMEEIGWPRAAAITRVPQ
jgi:hypothetical protein